MKAADVVTQLSVLLPQLTDKFTDDVEVLTIEREQSLVEMLVSCKDKHHLEVGNAFAIVNTDTPIQITSLTRSGTIGTLVTSAKHDLTRSIDSIGRVIGSATVRITGANESEFNDTFTIIDVVDRNTITFTMIDSGPTSATGARLRDAGSYIQSYNTIYEVSDVVNDAQIKFGHPITALASPLGDNMLLRTKPRISAGINLTRLIEAYTSYDLDQYWAFVVLGDIKASQSRRIGSDAIDDQQRNVNFRQQIIESFTVYVFIPVKNEIAAANARDEASDLLRPILRSLLFSKFDTGLYSGQLNTVQFAGHSVASYDTALYIHAYNFEQVAEIYQEDTVGPDDDVAFRDIDFKVKLDFGTQVNFMQGTPKLDDQT